MAKGKNVNNAPVNAPEAISGPVHPAHCEAPMASSEKLAQSVPVPYFLLVAGRPGHTRALRAAIGELAPPDSVEARAMLGAFKAFEKKTR
jgi:hypothetical protein